MEPTKLQSLLWQDILKERERQNLRFGFPPTHESPSVYLPVLVEEVGEVAAAMLEGDNTGYVEELVQVAAVALRALEEFYSGGGSVDLKDVCKTLPQYSHPKLKELEP